MIEFDCCFRKPMSFWRLLRHVVEQLLPLRRSRAASRESCRQPRRIMTLSTMTKFLTSRLCQESARLQLPSHLPSLTNQWVKSLQVCFFRSPIAIDWRQSSCVVNFIPPIPRGGNFGVKSVKFLYFLTNILLSSRA